MRPTYAKQTAATRSSEPPADSWLVTAYTSPAVARKAARRNTTSAATLMSAPRCTGDGPERWSLHQEVEHGEQPDLHDVHEVPVDGTRLHRLVPDHRQLSGPGLSENQREEKHASEHVGHVQAGHHVEQRRVDPVVDAETRVRVIPKLKHEKPHSEQDGQTEPSLETFRVAPSDRPDPGLEDEAAAHQHRGGHRRKPQLGDGDPPWRPRVVGRPDREVGAEERGEKHRLGGHEQDHAQDRPARPADRPLVEGGPGHAHGCPSADSPAWRASNTGRAERIGGRASKLWGGGGDDVAHSSVLAPHGSADAVLGLRSVTNTLAKKIAIDTAIRKAPAVAARLRKLHPRPGA